jgi:hypothetical protein
MSLAQFTEIKPAGLAIGGAVAMVLLGLLIWGARNLLVWRLLSVLGMGTGAGFLVWGIMLASLKQESPIGSAAAVIAVGAGVLVGAIVLLVVSFCGSCTGRRG